MRPNKVTLVIFFHIVLIWCVSYTAQQVNIPAKLPVFANESDNEILSPSYYAFDRKALEQMLLLYLRDVLLRNFTEDASNIFAKKHLQPQVIIKGNLIQQQIFNFANLSTCGSNFSQMSRLFPARNTSIDIILPMVSNNNLSFTSPSPTSFLPLTPKLIAQSIQQTTSTERNIVEETQLPSTIVSSMKSKPKLSSSTTSVMIGTSLATTEYPKTTKLHKMVTTVEGQIETKKMNVLTTPTTLSVDLDEEKTSTQTSFANTLSTSTTNWTILAEANKKATIIETMETPLMTQTTSIVPEITTDKRDPMKINLETSTTKNNRTSTSSVAQTFLTTSETRVTIINSTKPFLTTLTIPKMSTASINPTKQTTSTVPETSTTSDRFITLTTVLTSNTKNHSAASPIFTTSSTSNYPTTLTTFTKNTPSSFPKTSTIIAMSNSDDNPTTLTTVVRSTVSSSPKTFTPVTTITTSMPPIVKTKKSTTLKYGTSGKFMSPMANWNRLQSTRHHIVSSLSTRPFTRYGTKTSSSSLLPSILTTKSILLATTRRQFSFINPEDILQIHRRFMENKKNFFNKFVNLPESSSTSTTRRTLFPSFSRWIHTAPG